MFQNALISKDYIINEVASLYKERLNSLGDKVYNSYVFGIDQKKDNLDFIKIKNLLPVINIIDSTVILTKYNCNNVTNFLNKFISCLNS